MPVRQSGRTKKPSRRAEEMQQADAVVVASTGSTKRKHKSGPSHSDDTNVRDIKPPSSRQRKRSNVGEEDAEGSQQNSSDREGSQDTDREGEEEEEEENDITSAAEGENSSEVFCLCRKGDDGRPMVYCAECKDWFHFKCVGLTQKVAKMLFEFICPPCADQTGKESKTIDDDADEQPTSTEREQSDSYSPPRRPSMPLKRESTEDEGNRKRSKSSPHSPNVKKSIVSPSTAKSSSAMETTRKSSGSQSAPSGSFAIMKARSESLRKHATDQLANTFDGIFSEYHDLSGDNAETAAQGRQYAVDFEAGLFSANSERIGATSTKIASKSYRDRLRSFLFNLKDKNNTTLRQRIALNELFAIDLAAMSNEELANDEIRKEVERRKRENLEQSILKKEKAPLRKLTHKGEIDIEYETVHSSRIAEEREREREAMASKAADDSACSNNAQATADKKLEKLATSPPPSQDTERGSPSSNAPGRRISTSVQSPTIPFDFANVWTGEAVREEEEEEDGDEDQAEDVNGEKQLEQLDNTHEPDIVATDAGADNFIDNFLGMPDGLTQDDDQLNTAQLKSEGDIDTTDDASVRWRGAVSMPDEGVFTGKVRQVAGRPLTEQEWKSLFPARHTIIEGRLPSSAAATYLEQSQMAMRTELVVMTLQSSWEPEALADYSVGPCPGSETENVEAFAKMMSYFVRRDRYGVLPPHPAVRGRLVKDYYVAPLSKDSPIPGWMTTMQSDVFRGEASERRNRNLFLLVVVLFKSASAQVTPTAPQAIDSIAQGNQLPAGPASANLQALLGGSGSNTLQDLLKAVGGSRSPATPTGAGTGSQSPRVAASGLQDNPTEQHPSIQTLSEMPAPQLEDMLHHNPNLVDQLLKTIGAVKTQGTIRPPGPPPPPPPSLQGNNSNQRPPMASTDHGDNYMHGHNQYYSLPPQSMPIQGYGPPHYGLDPHQRTAGLATPGGYPYPPAGTSWQPNQTAFPPRPPPARPNSYIPRGSHGPPQYLQGGYRGGPLPSRKRP